MNNDLGYLYAEQGKNLEKAESMIRKAVQEEPDKPAYLDSLGWVLFKRGKAEGGPGAAPEGRRAAEGRGEEGGAPPDATIREHLGDVYLPAPGGREGPADLARGRADRLQGRPPRQAAGGDPQEAVDPQGPGADAQDLVDRYPVERSWNDPTKAPSSLRRGADIPVCLAEP